VKNLFEVATRQYSRAVPCLTFENVGWRSGRSKDDPQRLTCQKSPAIFVTSDPSLGCFSYVGVIANFPSQQLQLSDPGCCFIGSVIHEIGHALGMAHEQSRPDRDEHVHILWDNIQRDQWHNFKIWPQAYTDIPYDYLSVMHYDEYAFGVVRGMPTIEAARSGHPKIGQRVGLAASDVQQVSAMYTPEVPSCRANALNGTGCADRRPFSSCKSPGSGGLCSWTAFHSCCACGGGTIVQCFEGLQIRRAMLAACPRWLAAAPVASAAGSARHPLVGVGHLVVLVHRQSHAVEAPTRMAVTLRCGGVDPRG